jgi:PAS domain S-box-containing protein
MKPPHHPDPDYFFFRNGGQAGAVMRAMDWKRSSLGDPALWPQSLKNAIRLILDNAAPMYIAWGNGLIQFYNDGYLPILGPTKHPHAIGASTKDTFREIWPSIGPMFDQVLGGDSLFNEDLNLPLERNGIIADSFFTFSYSPLRDDDGNVAGVFVVAVETTSKVVVRQELERSRKELHEFFMQAPVPMVILEGPNHLVTLANPPYVKLSGREVLGKTIADAFPQGEAASFIPLLDGVYRTGVPYIGKELSLQLPDEKGAIQDLWIDIGYHPFRDSDNTIKGVFALVHDVTHQVQARKAAEQSWIRAQKSEKQLLDVLESTADGFIELDKDYKVVRVNKTQERITGTSRNETVGKNHWDVWPKHIIPEIAEAYQKVVQENVPVRVEYFNAALKIWLDVDAYPTPEGGLAAFFRDVTIQTNALSKIESQRERFSRLASASGIGVWYCDLPFSDLIWDEKVKEHFWLPADAEVTIDTFYERIHPQDRESVRSAIETAIQTHTRYDTMFRTFNPHDERDNKWIRAIGWTDYDESGKAIRFDGVTLDVSANKIAEQALRESEGRQKLLSEKMLQGVVHHRRDGSILSMNPSAHRILGTSDDSFNPLRGVPEHPNMRENGSLLPEREHPIMLAVETGKSVIGTVLGIYNTKENSYRWIEKDAVPLFRAGESTPYEVFAIFSDITEKKRIEVELRHTSDVLKESVSNLELERELRERFVATLTHDLRTPIGSAKMCSHLILRKADGQEAIENLAARSVRALDRANDMIQDLLDANLIRAGEKLPLELSEINLTQLVSDTLDELRTLHGDRIELLADGEITGFWSRSGLRRVLENLVNNAVKYGAHARPIRVSLDKQQNSIQLSVHNEGEPIPKMEQSKLFEPFRRIHSVHEVTQKGWGLGLTLVKGITEAQGGKVEVSSDIRMGTIFLVTLPFDARSN